MHKSNDQLKVSKTEAIVTVILLMKTTLIEKLLPYLTHFKLNLQTIFLVHIQLNKLNNIWNIKVSTNVHVHFIFRFVLWKKIN
jgi:hypothetical protein